MFYNVLNHFLTSSLSVKYAQKYSKNCKVQIGKTEIQIFGIYFRKLNIIEL